VAGPRLVTTTAKALGAEAARRLRHYGVCDIAPGLSGAELDRVEREFGFTFADDHRAFLAAGLPVNSGLPPPQPGVYTAHPEPWPDWRNGPHDALHDFLTWPTHGVLLDVRRWHWREAWGPRPSDQGAAVELARQRLAEVPVMAPVYGHRYLPAGRGTHGHPVLSMWQTDIIVYGNDLADYIDNEFGQRTTNESEEGTRADKADPVVSVEFWRDYL
jgi:hypothetical protein